MQIFNYNGSSITFQLANGDVMANLTEMSKPFGKLPADFLRLEQTKQFIEALEERFFTMGIPIVNIQNGGTNPGTWGHQKLALKFASWLNPKFELWVYDRIEELLKHGVTAVDPEAMLNDPDYAIRILTKLKEERAQKKILAEQNDRQKIQLELQETVIKEAVPKVEYYDKVLQPGGIININNIAKELGMSAVKLNKILNANDIQYLSNGTWVLFAKYEDKGYTKTKTFPYPDSHGATQTRIHTYWTEKGREFIHQVIKNLNLSNKKANGLQQAIFN